MVVLGTATVSWSQLSGRDMQADGLRIAMISFHTSPLDQPGIGDAGGLNVYLRGLSTALAAAGAEITIFTRPASHRGPSPQLAPPPRIRVAEVPLGGGAALTKDDLPRLVPRFAAELRAQGAPGDFDILHSHYWLSGLVGLELAPAWGVPLAHTMHTVARMKDLNLAPGEEPEPAERISAEDSLAAASDALIASTDQEARALVELCGAPRHRVHVIAPGVDAATFQPGDQVAARRSLGLAVAEPLLLFVGRIQPLKSPDVIIRALALLRDAGQPVPRLVVLGGPSGSPDHLTQVAQLACDLGVADRVVRRDPVPPSELAMWYRAADAVAMPSRSETFGFVAAEAQASGTPVLAAAVGGLAEIIADGVSGMLIPSHEPQDWARAIARLLGDRAYRATLAAGARQRRETFTWPTAAHGAVAAYRTAISHHPSHTT